MSDRFKFRFWDKETQTMQKIPMVELRHRITLDKIFADDRVIFMQCTGLKDKNGKLIYEGDILQSEEYPFKNDRGYNYSAEVCYDEESASYFYYVFRISTNVVGRAEGNTGHLDDYEWEVIGNIYENKELLESEEQTNEK